MSTIYYDTLGQALQAHIEAIEKAGGVFMDNKEEMYIFFQPISYGTTAYDHRELLTYKGRNTKKYAHASIYRMETGRYELTSYIS
jgi:hypothetical protein